MLRSLRILAIFLIGVICGMWLRGETTVLRTNCDTVEYGYMWEALNDFESLTCRDSNVEVSLEKRPTMIGRMVYNKFIMTLRHLDWSKESK